MLRQGPPFLRFKAVGEPNGEPKRFISVPEWKGGFHRYRSDQTCPDKSGLNQRSLCLWTAQDGVVPLSPVSVAPDLA